MNKPEPNDPKTYTRNFDTFYTAFSTFYDFMVKHSQKWQSMLKEAIPYIIGPRVLEVSFGTGWLITQYADRYDTYGIDFNKRMVQVTSHNLQSAGKTAHLQQANVEALPYRADVFDTIVNTAAFSGYPRADLAMSEFQRVLKPGGRLVLVDIGYPQDGNWAGNAVARFTDASGDIVRDMEPIFNQHSFEFESHVIGLSGALYLYLAQKD